MAKTYAAPKGIKVPTIDWNNYDHEVHEQMEEKFFKDLKAYVLKRKKVKNVGEIIGFQVGDGYAKYMVASMKPLELIHMPLGDAWEFQYVQNLKAKDVQDLIDQAKKMAELFG